MDSISIIRIPIESELEAFKELYDSSLSSSNTLLDSVAVSYTHLDVYKRQGQWFAIFVLMKQSFVRFAFR